MTAPSSSSHIEDQVLNLQMPVQNEKDPFSKIIKNFKMAIAEHSCFSIFQSNHQGLLSAWSCVTIPVECAKSHPCPHSFPVGDCPFPCSCLQLLS